MKRYQIKDWNEHFENNKSRERELCSWCPIKNKQDGLGYGRLMRMPDGPSLYGAFVAVVLMASKQKCPRDGHLTGTGRADGRPLSADDISIKTQVPTELIQRMLDATISESIDWMLVFEHNHKEIKESARQVPAECPSGALEEKRREEKEEKGKEKPPAGYHQDARTVLHLLNELAGVHFRELDSNLAPISQRLNEPGVTIDGVKLMLQRQCKKWKGTKMAEYLRPATLFAKKKFDGYYANREQPIINEDDRAVGPKRINNNQGNANALTAAPKFERFAGMS